VVETPAEAAALAVNRGCDLNCGETYIYLQEAVEQGLISEETITRSVKRLFEARFRLGMFDPPERVPYAQIPYAVNDCPAHRALALQAARESIVLLKNEGNLLPLRKDLRSIAVIGPNADDVTVLWGNYNGTPMQPVTPLEGIRAAVSPATTVYTARGCDIAPGVRPLSIIPSACLRPSEAGSAQRGLTAAYYAGPNFEGEPAFTRVDPSVDFVWKGTTPISGAPFGAFAVRWSGWLVPPVSGEYELGASGLSDFRLLLDSEPLLEYRGIHHPVVQKKRIALEAGRLYRLQLDYVNTSADPQMQLFWSPPGAEDTEQALAAARQAEVVVLVLGISAALEGEEMPVEIEGFDHGDRTSLDLPRPQQELLERIHALGKPIVLVLLNGSALAIGWAQEHIPAIVEAWYPGQAGGTAIADVLFGDYNPAGRLPVTFYRSVDDLPPFEDYAVEGHTYRYFRGEPLYPFGYGLSYTRFAYSNLRLSATRIRAGEGLIVEVDVENIGERAGDEVVQLYVRDLEASVPIPIRSLQGFRRVHLIPGQKETVRFTLAPSQFALVDERGERVIEPGLFQIAVGGRQPTPQDETLASRDVLVAPVEVVRGH
jgi:beta-glucosidase